MAAARWLQRGGVPRLFFGTIWCMCVTVQQSLTTSLLIHTTACVYKRELALAEQVRLGNLRFPASRPLHLNQA